MREQAYVATLNVPLQISQTTIRLNKFSGCSDILIFEYPLSFNFYMHWRAINLLACTERESNTDVTSKS